MSGSVPVPGHALADGALVGAMSNEEATEIRDAAAVAASGDRAFGAFVMLPKLLGVTLFVAQGPYGQASVHAQLVAREIGVLAKQHHASREVPQ